MQPRLKKLSESAQEEAHDKHSVLVETLSGLETVKILGAGGLLRKRFKNVVTQQAKSADETKRHLFVRSHHSPRRFPMRTRKTCRSVVGFR